MATAVSNKKDVLRDKRAQGIAAMGLVTRQDNRFHVQTPSLRGRRTAYEVWRDDTNRVRCTCLEYEENITSDATFRCEHILAVKHSLAAKNTEAATKPEMTAKQDTVEPEATSTVTPSATANDALDSKAIAPIETPVNQDSSPLNRTANDTAGSDVAPAITLNASASEKRDETRFGRERANTEQAAEETSKPAAKVSTVRSLAQHTQQKEQEMQQARATVNEQPFALNQANDDETSNESFSTQPPQLHTAHVVPLAFTNILRTLRQPVEAKLVKTREGWTDRNGDKHFVEYIEWHTVADTLDRVCPTWEHKVKDIKLVGDMVAVIASITIDGVTREGVGTGSADNETGIKKAEHDALKRAAVKFGLARDLYQRETEVTESTVPTIENEFPRDPLAKSMADLVTPKQLGMIRALAREANIEVDEECQNVLRCRPDELSKKAASAFIDHLKNAQTAVANTALRRAS